MYFIKRVKLGGNCLVGDLLYGESDVEMSLVEINQAVASGVTIYGYATTGMQDIQDLAISYFSSRGVMASKCKEGNINIMCNQKLGFYGETLDKTGKLRVNLWDVRNAKKFLGL